ncbi:high mobility group protein 20A isoform X2 [Orussus abietinus]|uniref:high mobility group protein 20A isoform X2 n=1 Tax=Orussus abietinus TaxID=222816 RepID=UPI000C715C83|nr:high mobility group protein 20A isoform X2 [Orussus abietinus]
MSESTPMNQVPESNGGTESAGMNGEAGEHPGMGLGALVPPVELPPNSEDKPLDKISNDMPDNVLDKTPDSVSEGGAKKGVVTPGGNGSAIVANRAKKRKKVPRDATAPKQPLTGYFRFLNDRREKVRGENPSMSFAEITKLLASEWSNLPVDQKQQYLDAAEQDKERYNREFSDYKQTEAYRIFSERQSSEKHNESKRERNGADTTLEQNDIQQDKDNDFSGFDIPIFTEEFLDHNKACEAELRQLRKATSDYEAQNAVLQRHVDSLHAAVNRLESETNQQRVTNQALQRHLDSLRSQMAGCFAAVPLQGTHEGATPQNVDGYVERLESMLSGNVEPSLRSAVRNAIARLEPIG